MNIKLIGTTDRAKPIVGVDFASVAFAHVAATWRSGFRTIGGKHGVTTICLIFSSTCSISFIAITRNRTWCCSITVIPTISSITRLSCTRNCYISAICTGAATRHSRSSTSCYSYCISVRCCISSVANILIWNSKCIPLGSYNITDVSLNVLLIL